MRRKMKETKNVLFLCNRIAETNRLNGTAAQRWDYIGQTPEGTFEMNTIKQNQQIIASGIICK